MQLASSFHSFCVKASHTRTSRFDTSFSRTTMFCYSPPPSFFHPSTAFIVSWVIYTNTYGAQVQPPCIFFFYKVIILPLQSIWLRLPRHVGCHENKVSLPRYLLKNKKKRSSSLGVTLGLSLQDMA